ncbi:MAG TPA: hypothetical protein VI759_02070 [Dehalococcoidia bacterium]|nr:hypothetical protein [Dehalococcoidia bacterium]
MSLSFPSFPIQTKASWSRVWIALLILGAVVLGLGSQPALRHFEASGSAQPALVSQVGDASRIEVANDTSSVTVEAAPAPVAIAEAPAAAPAQVAQTTAPATTLAASAAPVAAAPGERWRAEGISFEIEGQEWDARSLANVDAALALLPSSVRTNLGNRALGPLHIIVNSSGRTLSGSQPLGRAANFFSTVDGRNELVLFPGQSVGTITHELGHAYNLRRSPAGRYALVLLDPEMQSFMAATGWAVTSTPSQVNAVVDQTQVAYTYDGGFTWARMSNMDPLEDFANSFSLFFTDRGELGRQSPARLAWFQAIFG